MSIKSLWIWIWEYSDMMWQSLQLSGHGRNKQIGERRHEWMSGNGLWAADPHRPPSGSRQLPAPLQVKAGRWSLLLLSASNLNAHCNPANEDESETQITQIHTADCPHAVKRPHDKEHANNTAPDVEHRRDTPDSEVQTQHKHAACSKTMQPLMYLLCNPANDWGWDKQSIYSGSYQYKSTSICSAAVTNQRIFLTFLHKQFID